MLCLKDFELKRSETTAGVVSCTFLLWIVLVGCLYVFLVPSEDTRNVILKYALYTVIVFVILVIWALITSHWMRWIEGLPYN